MVGTYVRHPKGFATTAATFAIAGLLASGAAAQSSFNEAQSRFDIDGNDVLSENELPPILKRNMRNADADGSGDISPSELHWLLGSLLPQRVKSTRDQNPAPKLAAASQKYTWGDVDRYIAQFTETLPLEGANLIVIKKGKILHQASFGLYDVNTEIPIASSTKWLHAALIMTLVDEGTLSLDEPISKYLDWADGPMGNATLRQMLSHTAGFGPSHLAEQSIAWNLEQSARDAYTKDSIGNPGMQFRYGGIGMQLSAYIAEKVTWIPYAELLEQRLTKPLGMTNTYIGWGRKREARDRITNPIAAAGGYSTAADYIRFLEMLTSNGQFRGKTILSPSAISHMFRDYSNRRAKLGAQTNVGTQRGYGLGAWCSKVEEDGHCPIMQSGGAFGTSPTIVMDDQTAILFMTKDRMPLIRDHMEQVSGAIAQILEED